MKEKRKSFRLVRRRDAYVEQPISRAAPTTEYIRADTNHIRPAMPYPSISWMTPRSSIAAEFEPVIVVDVDPSEDGDSDEGSTESPAGKLNVSCTPFFIVVFVVAISCALKLSTQDREPESS